MATTISEAYHIARKRHECMAWDFIFNSEFDQGVLTFSELRAIARAKQAGRLILPGDRYIQQVCKEDGELYVFKAKPELHEICLKHNLYEP